MNKKFFKIEKDILSNEEQINAKKQLLSDTESRLKKADLHLIGLQNSLKQAVVAEDKEKIEIIENQIADQGKLIGRDRLLIEGTKEIIEEEKKKNTSLTSERNELFKGLAAEWLKKEAKEPKLGVSWPVMSIYGR